MSVIFKPRYIMFKTPPMRLAYLLGCFLIFSALFGSTVYALIAIELKGDKEVLSLGPNLELFEDVTRQLTIDDITSDKYSANFIATKKENLNFGFSPSAYWIRFALANTLSEQKEYLLEVTFPLLDHVDLYQQNETGKFIEKKAGELVPIKQREIEYRNPVFSITLEPQEEKTLYLRIQNYGSVVFTPKLWEPLFFSLKTTQERYIYGFYYGGMIIIALYNLIIFLMVRIRTFLFYVVYVACFILWQTAYNGFANEILWPEQPWLTNRATPFIICATCIWALQFTKSFLDTAANLPVMDRFIKLLMVSFGIGLVISFQPNYSVSTMYSSFLALLLVPTVLFAGFSLSKKGYRPARYFSIAWFVLLIGTALLILKSFGILPSTFITTYGQQIGSFLEIILLSLALADLLNVMKKEKEQAQAEALHFQKLATRRLEEEVLQRTEELRASNLKLETLSAKLAKYLSPQLYNSIFSGKTDVKRQSYRKKLTIFFSDIKDFTKLTDSIEPETLTAIINNYLNEMAAIALRHGGTIDKYIGDAIMVFFGDPDTKGETEDALSCINMAIEMRERMKQMQREGITSAGTPPLQIRMGINSGYCTVGNFGSEERLDYTIIGGQVNIASRLESMAEPNEILISNNTYALVKDKVAVEEKGEIMVKGIAHPVPTYQVIDLHEKVEKEAAIIAESGDGYSFTLSLENLSEKSKQKALSSLQQMLVKLNGHTIG